ncbi:GDSL-type esterase/lipase family protein [Cesiribacter sp. SM1]|uniref:SGNH/GDSL hydrolase family protein n=1 Tax=Cesiribacter sp. SM1 TaxID=2861196 RepID=UPI001CD3B0E6|nr:GDSL-type esterase/lipase family protein [Cesiribacter sp. SM1]
MGETSKRYWVSGALWCILIHLLLCSGLLAQQDPVWDNTENSHWKAPFEQVEIPSTADGHLQKAFMYRSGSTRPKPLIVSLHTWSGDYTQKDPIAKEVLARDWNYIHPHFRGPNNTPQAMGSPLVLADIEDAIRYALANTNADPEEVHIIGVSGGGYATLLAYMNGKYPVKSFSAWAPISDIEAWYWESVGRRQKYAKDILQALSSDSLLPQAEARKRSPLKQKYPAADRKDAKLYIYEGVHDGYEGSVPITHSINMYNRLVGELKWGLSDLEDIMPKAASDPDLVSEKEVIELLTKRYNPDYDPKRTLFGRNIYLYREWGNIQLTIFEGGHEQIPQALALIPYNNTAAINANILCIGDSNAANKEGWVTQLQEMIPESALVNISRSGRTIGFDNGGRAALNALKNIDGYLREARERIGNRSYDYIILCLGTNDTKQEFAERQEEVVANFEKLLSRIQKHPLYKKDKPGLIVVTPPPISETDIEDKYQGGNARLRSLVPRLQAVAEREGCTVVDVYHPLLGVLNYYAPDGVHMVAAGQKIIAASIVDALLQSERLK